MHRFTSTTTNRLSVVVYKGPLVKAIGRAWFSDFDGEAHRRTMRARKERFRLARPRRAYRSSTSRSSSLTTSAAFGLPRVVIV
jgi:hypothetical protein